MRIQSHIVRFGVAAFVAAVAAPVVSAQEASFAEARLAGDGKVTESVIGSDRIGATYQSGSIGKFACTLAALRMVDRGKLDLDRPVSQILPEYVTDAEGVTMRHLLANRSGLADGLLPAFRADPTIPSSTISALEAANTYADKSNGSKSGESFSYDLVNWIVVQAVLEKISGQSINTLLENTVIKPAGMKSTYTFSGQIGERGQQPATPAMDFPAFLTCAGGLATTPGDLLSLLRFPHKGGLSAQSLVDLTTVTTPAEYYTLGGRYFAKDNILWSWQSGSNGPYKSVAIYDPTRDIGYAAMTAGNDKKSLELARDRWIKLHSG